MKTIWNAVSVWSLMVGLVLFAWFANILSKNNGSPGDTALSLTAMMIPSIIAMASVIVPYIFACSASKSNQ